MFYDFVDIAVEASVEGLDVEVEVVEDCAIIKGPHQLPHHRRRGGPDPGIGDGVPAGVGRLRAGHRVRRGLALRVRR